MTITHAVFESSAGPFALLWNQAGLAGVALAATDGEQSGTPRVPDGSSRARTVPGWVRRTARRVGRHLEGSPQGFSDVALDVSRIPPFHARVLKLVRGLVPGSVVSHAWLASRAKEPGATRGVSRAIAGNPWPVVVPCHRVVASGAHPGGYSGAGGLATKEWLLAAEGVRLDRSVAAGGYRTTGLAFDARAALAVLGRDPVLRPLMRRGGPFAPDLAPAQSPYEALAEAIVYQQLSGRAAGTIHARVEALGGNRFPSPDRMLALPEAKLRGAGLSRAKTAAMRDLARRALDGTVPGLATLRRLPDDEIVERLTEVRGVGRWTVEMFLLFRLGRGDVWPVDDLGVRKGFARAAGFTAMPTAKELMAEGERWRPYRSVAAWYCWRALDAGG
ncbi:MAG: methylated-DNA--[protein]-cysteine S-methyltransferase [Gemmatimonadales bacterium]